MGNDSPLLIGNTATAIRRAIDAGVDWIEINIRASADRELVVFHDESLNLKTSGTGKIQDLSKEDIQKAQLLVDPPESILTLEETFVRFHSKQHISGLIVDDPGNAMECFEDISPRTEP